MNPGGQPSLSYHSSNGQVDCPHTKTAKVPSGYETTSRTDCHTHFRDTCIGLGMQVKKNASGPPSSICYSALPTENMLIVVYIIAKVCIKSCSLIVTITFLFLWWNMCSQSPLKGPQTRYQYKECLHLKFLCIFVALQTGCTPSALCQGDRVSTTRDNGPSARQTSLLSLTQLVYQ